MAILGIYVRVPVGKQTKHTKSGHVDTELNSLNKKPSTSCVGVPRNLPSTLQPKTSQSFLVSERGDHFEINH